MVDSSKLTKEIQQIKNIIWLFFILLWLLRFGQGLLLHQLYKAPFISVQADNVFWLWHSLGLVHYSIQNFALGLGLDLAWLLLALGGLIKKINKQWIFLFLLIFWNYFIVYNSIATHHEHTLVAPLFLGFLLLINPTKNFVLSFAALRYYTIFAMTSAALWKIARGAAFDSQMIDILKGQHLDYLTNYPNAFYSQLIYYVINNALVADFFWYSGWLLELFFVVGFFTRKYDRLLGVAFFAFFVADYLLMDISFLEFCIFAILFYPFGEIWGFYNQLKNND